MPFFLCVCVWRESCDEGLGNEVADASDGLEKGFAAIRWSWKGGICFGVGLGKGVAALFDGLASRVYL